MDFWIIESGETGHPLCDGWSVVAFEATKSGLIIAGDKAQIWGVIAFDASKKGLSIAAAK